MEENDDKHIILRTFLQENDKFSETFCINEEDDSISFGFVQDINHIQTPVYNFSSTVKN